METHWESEPTLGGLGSARSRLGRSEVRSAGGAGRSLRGLGRRLSRWGRADLGRRSCSPWASTVLVALTPRGFVCFPVSACLSLRLLSFSRCLSLSLLSLPLTFSLFLSLVVCLLSLSVCLCFSLSLHLSPPAHVDELLSLSWALTVSLPGECRRAGIGVV